LTGPTQGTSLFDEHFDVPVPTEGDLLFVEHFDLPVLTAGDLLFLEPFDYRYPNQGVSDGTLTNNPIRLVRLEVGESPTNRSVILNCKNIKWRDIHAVTPQLMPTAKIPANFLQSCVWIEGEFRLQTDDAIFGTYAPPDEEAVIIPYFIAFTEDINKVLWRYTFDNLIITSIERELNEDKEPTTVYKFMAFGVAEAVNALLFIEHFDVEQPHQGRRLFSEGFNS
jgi:hypothetical protein